jgi:ABC-type polysaccharide/polyol phosphate transport system ATPase subunit
MALPAIVAHGVHKDFDVPHQRVHTLKERAMHPFRRRSYERFRAVEDVSFTVEEGEFFGIVGRNGSGKSTLLKVMAGIYRASAGEIWVRGRMSTFIELGVGFNPDLAARDNVLLNAIMLGLTPAEAEERYERVIDFAELREFEDLKLKNYSSGMHVRLAFSVMIQVDADVLLIDEVLAVGDAAFQQKCFDEFHRLREAGKTVVLVTHDMGAVRRFCDRAMLLDNGRMVAEGDAEDIGGRYLDLNFRNQETAVSDDGDRHGDRAAEIEDVWVETPEGERVGSIQHGSELVVKATVRFHQPMQDPYVGITLENEQLHPVFVANSMWSRHETGAFAAGEVATIELRFRNDLAPGRYHLSPSISRRGSGLELADWRIRFGSFLCTGAVETGGVVQPPHDIELVARDRQRVTTP